MKDHISVCVPTFRRNQMLGRLLRNLALQETGGLFDLSVVVVDNDASGPAKETVMGLRGELGLDITYGIEPEQTIPAARNHALRLARGNYIGIIDDDEFPPQHWLITMYRAIQAFGVDGALGPVHPFFEKQPPSWLVKSRFCERPVHRTGTLLYWDQTRTGNVLLKKDVFDKYNLCFDVKFKTGGSDREFFKHAMQVGCRFVAVEEAPVYEIVPSERWAKSYYLKRALVNGFNSHRNSLGQIHGLSHVMVSVKSTGALLAYAMAVPFCAILGSHVLMNCLERGCHHLSRLLAMMGIELVKKRNF
jgi:glycosyltransferase involved in cell wall biosynthesis